MPKKSKTASATVDPDTANGQQVFKIVVLGPGAVGKSALTISLVSHHFVSVYDPTIEDSYRTQAEIDGKVAVLDILDTAGQDEYSAMRDQYLTLGNGFLFVYAINSRESFEDLPLLRMRLYKVKDKDYSEQLPIVLAGNKCDLINDRQVPVAMGEQRAQEWNCKFMETSALSRVNVENAYYEIVKQIRVLVPITKPASKGKCCML
ncbi:Ras GTPase [Pelomyxa schiedti]|nr:Ras GTPase [Pelomyxa schiedti]